MIDFRIGNAVYVLEYVSWNTNWSGDWPRDPPPGRRTGPAGCPTAAMAGTCCTSTDINAHTAPIRMTLQTQYVIFWAKVETIK